jgi:catechol 2,3-dioxygenase-like lactoylglutathione lyase family enzyme
MLRDFFDVAATPPGQEGQCPVPHFIHTFIDRAYNVPSSKLLVIGGESRHDHFAMTQIDHLILNVNELDPSIDFYVNIMGFKPTGGDHGPYTEIRVNEDFTILLAPYGTEVSQHLAFALTRADFDKTVALAKARAIPHGSSYDNVGSNTGPGVESGSRGPAPTLYMLDPSNNLIEIRTYE